MVLHIKGMGVPRRKDGKYCSSQPMANVGSGSPLRSSQLSTMSTPMASNEQYSGRPGTGGRPLDRSSSIFNLISTYETNMRKQSEAINRLQDQILRIKHTPLRGQSSSSLSAPTTPSRNYQGGASGVGETSARKYASPEPSAVGAVRSQSDNRYMRESSRLHRTGTEEFRNLQSSSRHIQEVLQGSTPTGNSRTVPMTPYSGRSMSSYVRGEEEADVIGAALENHSSRASPGEHLQPVQDAARKWSCISERMETLGLGSIDLSRAETSVPEAILSVLDAYDEQFNRVHRLEDEKQRLEESVQRAGAADDLVQENEELRERLRGAENVHEKEMEQMSDDRRTLQDKVTALEKKLAALSDARSERDTELADANEKISKMFEQEEEHRERCRLAFKELRGRTPREQSTEDRRLMSLLSSYELHRVRNEAELDTFRDQVRNLRDELRRTESVLRKRTADTVTDEDVLTHLQRERERYEAATRQALEREKEFREQLNEADDRIDELRRKVRELEGRNEELSVEVNARPTIKEWKRAQNTIDELEDKLHSRLEELVVEQPILKHTSTTREAMRRDRDLHRLGLSKILDYPEKSVRSTLQEVCRLLRVSDLPAVVPALEKITAVMSAVPRMEQFIAEVCDLTKTPDTPIAKLSPSRVLDRLKRWRSKIDASGTMDRFRADIIRLLERRSTAPERINQWQPSNEEILKIVDNMIREEDLYMNMRQNYEDAEVVLKSNPDALLHKIVAHFRHLFDVKQMQGVLPRMNEVYLTLNELQNGLRALRTALGADDSVAMAECIRMVRSHLDS